MVDAAASPRAEADRRADLAGPNRQSWSANRAAWSDIERGVALIALALLGVNEQLTHGITVGLILGVVLLPVWARHVGRFSGAKLVMALGVVTLIAGYLLNKRSSGTHTLIKSEYFRDTFLLITVLCGVGIILWARTLFTARTIGLAFGVGLAMHAAAGNGQLTASNPLKFVWTIPVIVLVLAAAEGHRRLAVQLLCLIGLAVGCGAVDARASLGACLIAALVVVWQLRPRLAPGRKSWVMTTALFAGLAIGVYYLASSLLINGYLGQKAQTRSLEQMQATGSLLLGGRPELAASWALFKHFPGGFGPGVAGNADNVAVAKAGMASINYDPNNGYVDHFMFGTSIELHSGLGDLWVRFGLLGIVFCAVIIAITIRNLSMMVAARRATGLVVFLGLWLLWNMGFSPIGSGYVTLMLGLGLLLFPRTGPSFPSSQGSNGLLRAR